MDPQQWLLQYDEQLKEVAARAEQTEKTLRELGGSAASPGGEVLVKVSAGGALTDLVLRPGARDIEPEQLARLIMETTRAAQRDAGAQVVDAMRGLVGESEALEIVKSNLPVGFAGDGTDEPADTEQQPDTRPDDEYFENPPEVIQ